MIKKLVQFSMDLYDIESGATLSVESDHLIINFGGKRQIILWVVDHIFQCHAGQRVNPQYSVEFEIVKKVMELIEKYEEDSE